VRDSDDTQVLFETRYFVSSLDPDRVTPADLLRLARGHWQIENSLHFVKDRWWDEDRHYSIRPGLADTLAALVNMALTLLRLSERFAEELPLRGRADQLSWTPLQALEVIGAPPDHRRADKTEPTTATNRSTSAEPTS
jgi:Transposase DDE domain